MSDEYNVDLNEALGQLEDELRQVRSAREQVDGVLAANEELAEIARRSSAESKAAADALTREAGRLEGCAEKIERASTDGVEAIREQASGAQASLEQSARYASSAASRGVREAGERAVAAFDESLREATSGIDAAVGSLRAAATGLAESRDALVSTYEAASGEFLRQSSETKELLEATRAQLEAVEEKVATLSSVDLEGMSDRIAKLAEAEEANSAMLRGQLRTLTILVGICLAVCAVVLVRLLTA